MMSCVYLLVKERPQPKIYGGGVQAQAVSDFFGGAHNKLARLSSPALCREEKTRNSYRLNPGMRTPTVSHTFLKS